MARYKKKKDPHYRGTPATPATSSGFSRLHWGEDGKCSLQEDLPHTGTISTPAAIVGGDVFNRMTNNYSKNAESPFEELGGIGMKGALGGKY